MAQVVAAWTSRENEVKGGRMAKVKDFDTKESRVLEPYVNWYTAAYGYAPSAELQEAYLDADTKSQEDVLDFLSFVMIGKLCEEGNDYQN